MPDKTVRMLSYVAVGLVVSYIGLVIATVYFATWQTSLAASVRATEGSIATLETSYYAAMARVTSTDPHALGLVAPNAVHYATEEAPASLTYAGR